MGCVSSLPPAESSNSPTTNNNDIVYKPITSHARQLEYPRTCNETIDNPYSINDWIEVREHVSNQWVIVTIIDKHNNWIRVLSQNINIQFTDKLHIIKDALRIRPLGADSDNTKHNAMTESNNNNNINNILYKNGFELINEIKYDESDTTKDTIYKSFEYRIYHSFGNDTFKENISLYIKNNQTNNNNDNNNDNNISLLTDDNLLVLLSEYSKLNIISYILNENETDLKIKTDHKYTQNENKNDSNIQNTIYLLYIPKLQQYKLMSITMNKIVKLINENNDFITWNCSQVIKWLNMIEFGLFNDSKYDNLKINIQKLDINGSNINKINDLTLRSMGINDEIDQKLIIENINKLIYEPKDTHTKNIIEEEEEDENDVITAGNIDTSNIDMNIEIPESFLDPIHWNIMTDPVLSIVSGHSFERQSITEWILQNHTDPINQKELHLYQLVPNRTLREAIDRFLKIYGSQFTQNIQTKR